MLLFPREDVYIRSPNLILNFVDEKQLTLDALDLLGLTTMLNGPRWEKWQICQAQGVPR